jgi:hypothetical protein
MIVKAKIRTVLLIAVIISVLLNGCAGIHSGTMLNSVALSSPNFTYVKRNIQGTSTATYFLGIGGLKRQTLVEEAKQDMLFTETGSVLSENQALANVTINFKTTYLVFGLYVKVTCTVGADVVQFIEKS